MQPSVDLYKEFIALVQLALPVLVSYVLEFLPGITSILLVGHLPAASMQHPLVNQSNPHNIIGSSSNIIIISSSSSSFDQDKRFIDATSLAVMLLNFSGISIGFGLATALDTLASQAVGANQVHQLGVYLQTGSMVLTLACLPIFAVNYFASDILISLHLPQEVAQLAGQFARYMLPGVPFLFAYELFKKILQAMNIVRPMMYIALFGNIVNITVGYVLVYHTSWGFLGAAIARSISNVAFPFCLIPFLLWSTPSTLMSSSSLSSSFAPPCIWDQFWTGWQIRKAVRQIPRFLALGLSGTSKFTLYYTELRGSGGLFFIYIVNMFDSWNDLFACVVDG